AKGLALEALVAVTPAPGKPRLKWLVVSLPAGADRAMTHLPGDYAGATLTVVDASPFPRSCPSEGGCVDQLTPPTDIDRDAPQMVSGLTRVSGQDPTVDGSFGVVGVAQLDARAKICVDVAGRVTSIELVQPSASAKYDQRIVETVKQWVFAPYVFAGKSRPACTNASFRAYINNTPGWGDGLPAPKEVPTTPSGPSGP
ncbi:MAG TPA: hypothetical protein VFV99_02420, partial [Kofleriaceae bacterium]|nr:hypothetical protein [Kofleriaceae bacterium]